MNQILVVLDTNILVSALLSPYGPPARVLDLALAGEVRLVFDDRLLAEYREVLARPKFKSTWEDVQALLDYLEAEGEPVVALPLLVALPDADDLPFLEVTAQAGAILITGNKAHYVVAEAETSVMIMTPREFLDYWGSLK
jgi:putative PIN family toxin of toxin-antitoxin system